MTPQGSFFVVAHQDDWQLFMGDVVVEKLRSGLPVTIIYLTAGDDGRDSVYWRTRELAALASTRIAIGEGSIKNDSADCAPVSVRGHSIRRCLISGIASYFLRLPDGNRNGSGFARYDSQSMRRLRAGKINAMTAVDGSATYKGWDDLVSTVSDLFNDSTNARPLVHTTDPSIAVNPHDHYDHRVAGLLIEGLRRRQSMDVRYYVGYALSTRAANRSNRQAHEKTEVFLAYDEEMVRVNEKWSAYRERPGFYSNCMMRTYGRSPRAR